MTRAKFPFELRGEHLEARPQSGDRIPSPASTTDAASGFQQVGNLQVQALYRAGKLQTFAEVGRPDDVEEQEAERIADHVLQAEAPSRLSNDGDGSTIRRKSESNAASALASDGLVSSLGPGKPLDATEQSYFAPRFDMAFDDVRIHTGPEASESAAAVHASAFTLGSNVVFGEGRYQPGTADGRRLLAHELAHVAQQRSPGAKGTARPVIRRDENKHGEPDAGPPETRLDATGVVNDDMTAVYDSARREPGVIQILVAGTQVRVTHNAGNYYRVLIGETKGYIVKSQLSVSLTEEKQEKEKKTEEKKAPDSYQGIIDKALTPLTGDDVTFYHLDAGFGFNMVKDGCDLAKQLPAGTGDKTGWARKKVSPLFQRVGAVTGGPSVYAMVIYQGGHFIIRTAIHEHTIIDGEKRPGHFPDALEAFWVHPDWAKRLADAEKKKK